MTVPLANGGKAFSSDEEGFIRTLQPACGPDGAIMRPVKRMLLMCQTADPDCADVVHASLVMEERGGEGVWLYQLMTAPMLRELGAMALVAADRLDANAKRMTGELLDRAAKGGAS